MSSVVCTTKKKKKKAKDRVLQLGQNGLLVLKTAAFQSIGTREISMVSSKTTLLRES